MCDEGLPYWASSRDTSSRVQSPTISTLLTDGASDGHLRRLVRSYLPGGNTEALRQYRDGPRLGSLDLAALDAGDLLRGEAIEVAPSEPLLEA